mgnify:FL=1
MILPSFFDTKKSLNLFGISEYFKFLKNLYLKGKLPNVLMLSGKKGSGKSTLLNHFIFSIFDKENYDDKNYILNDHSFFYNQFINDIYPNIIYLSGTDIINSKIESIRDLKKKLFKTSISSKPRFIILDDVELFNTNSLNALLKTIEEPKKK